MKIVGQKAYHYQEKELWECMSEDERAEYHSFITTHEDVFRCYINNDRRYKRNNIGQSDIEFWEQIEDAGEMVNLTPTTGRRQGLRTGPDFVDMIEEAKCRRNGSVYYRDKLIGRVVESLSGKQQQTLELTVVHDFSTTDLAKMWGCSERNVRKLRERALHNVCERYAAALKGKADIALAEREFLAWYDAGKPAPAPQGKEDTGKLADYLEQRYNEECVACVTVTRKKNTA